VAGAGRQYRWRVWKKVTGKDNCVFFWNLCRNIKTIFFKYMFTILFVSELLAGTRWLLRAYKRIKIRIPVLLKKIYLLWFIRVRRFLKIVLEFFDPSASIYKISNNYFVFLDLFCRKKILLYYCTIYTIIIKNMYVKNAKT